MRFFARYRSSVALVLGLSFSVGLVWAALQNQPLLKVTRTDDPKFLNEISLNLDDDGNLVNLGVSLEKSPVTLEQLQKGFVLNRTSGIETVRLTAGKGFNLKSGGPLTLRYLKQFKLIGSNVYGEFRMDLVREGGRWVLRDQHHQDFNQLRMTAHSRGISDVSPVNASASQRVQAWIDESLLPAWDRDGEIGAVYSRGLTSRTHKEDEGSSNRIPAPLRRDSEADSAF